jgi:hypothetical protein
MHAAAWIRSGRWAILGLMAGCANPDILTVSQPQSSDTVPAQQPGPSKRPSRHWMRVSQYAICSDVELNPTDPFFRELELLPGQIQEQFKLPPGNGIIQVFLFETQDQYDSYMAVRYPKLPSRRAYFIAEPRAASTGDDLLVYTWMGDQLKTDLRHELTHAILHGVLKTVPLWLDEGIASYFELPSNANGVNSAHVDQLVKSHFQPDLARLETFGKVAQMEKPEYREAWAWVHFLIHSSPKTKELLIAYLSDMQTNVNPPPLLPKLREIHAEPDGELVDHLNRLPNSRVRN